MELVWLTEHHAPGEYAGKWGGINFFSYTEIPIGFDFFLGWVRFPCADIFDLNLEKKNLQSHASTIDILYTTHPNRRIIEFYFG